MEAFLLRHPGNTRKPFKLECFRKLLHCVRNCRSWISCEQTSCPETCKLHQESGWNETGWLRFLSREDRDWAEQERVRMWMIYLLDQRASVLFQFKPTVTQDPGWGGAWHCAQLLLKFIQKEKNPKQKSTKFNIDTQGTPVKCKWTVV